MSGIDIASDDDINFVIHQGPETVGKTHYAIACELRQHRDAWAMSSFPGFPSDVQHGFKADEERLLRKLEQYAQDTRRPAHADVANTSGIDASPAPVIVDHRWLAIARTHIQEGFAAIERAIVQRPRIKLPEDT